MSLENELKKNTAALEALTAAMIGSSSGAYVVGDTTVRDGLPTPGAAPTAPAAPALAPNAPAPAAPALAPNAPAPAAPVPNVPVSTATASGGSTVNPTSVPATAVMMTPEEFNGALVAEMTRINKGREPIDTVMAQMGISSVAGLTAEQQTQLMDTVKAIPA